MFYFLGLFLHAQGPGDKEEEVAFADSCLALAEATGGNGDLSTSCFGMEKIGIPGIPTRKSCKQMSF